MSDNSFQTKLSFSSGVLGLDDIDWTFEGADTQYKTHGVHKYPARMIPQIPSTLISHYLDHGEISRGDTIYDPFGGSGTTAVEAQLHGLNAVVNDINPFACLLTEAKSTPIETRVLRNAQQELLDGLDEEFQDITSTYKTGEVDFTCSDVREGWFPKPQLYHIVAVRQRIDELEDTYPEKVTRFLRICLSDLTRKVSYQREGEFKRHRIPESTRNEHNPRVLPLLRQSLQDNISLMEDFTTEAFDDVTTRVHYADSRTATQNGTESVRRNSADIAITSPPYGDHQTTVAYGQFSQDPAILAANYGYDEMKAVDKNGLGGCESSLTYTDELEQWSPAVDATLSQLEAADQDRADDAKQFLRDYYAVMREVAKIVKPSQPVAWVVANRTMSRVSIPLHLITRELCEQIGYTHEATLERDIPTKSLPWENAPENEQGNTGSLMADEHIIILKTPAGDTQ